MVLGCSCEGCCQNRRGFSNRLFSTHDPINISIQVGGVLPYQMKLWIVAVHQPIPFFELELFADLFDGWIIIIIIIIHF